MRLTSLSPSDWSGFSDGFRSTLDPFKPVSEHVRNEVPDSFDGPHSRDGDEAEREGQPVLA